jgi:hypothetical protein
MMIGDAEQSMASAMISPRPSPCGDDPFQRVRETRIRRVEQLTTR